VPVPWFFVTPASVDPELLVTDSRIAYPCVVKPLGLSGSRGVIRADSSRQLVAAIVRVAHLLQRTEIRALRSGLEDHLLIEEFIEGREYAVEAVLTDGALQLLTIFDKPDALDGPFFEETIYLTPSALPFEMQEAMAAQVQEAARALGLRHGPVHAECRVNRGGIFVLEAAARPIGGLCSRALRFDGGMSLEEVLLRHSLGEDVSTLRREAFASGVMMIPIPRRGLLKEVEGVDHAQQVSGIEEVLITAKSDQLLEPLPEAGSYLGFLFARAASAGEVEHALREAYSHLTFVINQAIDVGK
jgi:biotin carboxylase